VSTALKRKINFVSSQSIFLNETHVDLCWRIGALEGYYGRATAGYFPTLRFLSAIRWFDHL
jgi:hypothetical protein